MSTGILLSGGQDSVALAYLSRPTHAITIDYGQAPAEGEIRAASAVADALSIKHCILRIDCSSLGSGDLAGLPELACAPSCEWWPYRNQLLVTLALGSALRAGVTELLLGLVATDSSHVDGTAEFVEALDSLSRMQEGGLQVRAPAIEMTSAELVRRSKIPPELLYWAHSCHRSSFACGQCRGCMKHKNVMYELGEVPF